MVRLFRSQGSLLLENLALRQQLSVLKRRHPRPRLDSFDRLFWVVARRVWSALKQSCVATGNQAIFGADEILAKGRSGGPRRQAGNIVTFGRKLPLKNQTGVSVGTAECIGGQLDRLGDHSGALRPTLLVRHL